MITICKQAKYLFTSEWRHNEHDGVSNHQPHHCLVNRLLRLRSKKTSKLRVTGLCAGNSPVNSPHKGPETRKMFPFDDVIMRYHPLSDIQHHWYSINAINYASGHLWHSFGFWSRSTMLFVRTLVNSLWYNDAIWSPAFGQHRFREYLVAVRREDLAWTNAG